MCSNAHCPKNLFTEMCTLQKFYFLLVGVAKSDVIKGGNAARGK